MGKKESKYKGYDYRRQYRKDGHPLIVPALQKTFANMKDLKKYIDKHGKMESINEETDFIAFWNRKQYPIKGKDLWDAKQKAIKQLRIPKSKQGLLAIKSKKSMERGDYRFESKQKNEAIRKIIHSILKEEIVSEQDIVNELELIIKLINKNLSDIKKTFKRNQLPALGNKKNIISLAIQLKDFAKNNL